MSLDNTAVILDINTENGTDLIFVVSEFGVIDNLVFTASIYDIDNNVTIPFTITKDLTAQIITYKINWNQISNLAFETAYEWRSDVESGNGLITPLFKGDFKII